MTNGQIADLLMNRKYGELYRSVFYRVPNLSSCRKTDSTLKVIALLFMLGVIPRD